MTDTIENAINKSKPLRMNEASRDDVRKAFRNPLTAQNDAKLRAKQTEMAKRFHEDIYSVEERRAIAVLKKGGFSRSVTSLYVTSKERINAGSSLASRVDFGDACIDVVGVSQRHPGVSQTLLDEYNEAVKLHSARVKEIDTLVRELNTVLLVCKTRRELGEVWPPAYDLMGADWVNAAQEPNRLPMVTTTGITAAMTEITALAA